MGPYVVRARRREAERDALANESSKASAGKDEAVTDDNSRKE
jgi:hypothetical protein